MRSTDLSRIVTFAPRPTRDERRVVADDAAADDEHLRRAHARHAAEQEPAAALRLLEEARAHLRREAAGDLAHRREQRQLPVVGLDRLVRDGRDPAVDERTRERLVGGEVEVREEHEALAEPRVLGCDRLLHLEQELGLAPRPRRRTRCARRPPRTRRRRTRCPTPAPGLDQRRRGRAARARARPPASARRGTRRS